MNATPLNMHTDLVITQAGAGTVTLTGKDTSGQTHSIAMASSLAQRVATAAGRVAGLSTGARPAVLGMHAAPLNMHTDGGTKVSSSGPGSIVITGTATAADGAAVPVTVTIDGPAFATLRGAPAGL